LAVAGKLFSGLLIRERWHTRLAIGLAMVPRGEVGLIFAELGRSTGIFSNEVYAAMVIVIALTTLLPLFALKWLYRRYALQMPAAHGQNDARSYNADNE
jgi:Kef-type K+ transport system membrane component KefB